MVSITDEYKKLNNLDINKSPSPDGVHFRVLKELSRELAKPLHHIFETSITSSKIPTDWKDANVTAIHKKVIKMADNYRPISLTSVICKIMENIVRDVIMNHMKINNLFSNKQFGFLSGRSTTLQLLNVLDDWTEALDNGHIIDIIYTDIQKAFDSVPHKRLLSKIKSCGIEGNMLNCINTFLNNRRQLVLVNGT